jgi:hypothetical protein
MVSRDGSATRMSAASAEKCTPAKSQQNQNDFLFDV